MGMKSLVEATPMSRRTRMALCCIGPENFRGATLLALLQCSQYQHRQLPSAESSTLRVGIVKTPRVPVCREAVCPN